MSDYDLDVRLAAADPAPSSIVSALPLSMSEVQLMEDIMASGPTTAAQTSDRARRQRAHRGRRRVLVSVASVAAAATAFVGFTGLGPGHGGDGAAWAAPQLAVANGAPRYLVEASGWDVERVDEFAAADGEMTFSHGPDSLDLRWKPTDQYRPLLADRATSSDYSEETAVAGEVATLFRYSGTTDFTTLWRHEGHSLEARGDFRTIAAYRAVLRSLRVVDVDTWLRAMPSSVIKPDSRAAVVDGMLADMPKPPGFDGEALRGGATMKDRYQLGATVAGAVACGWFDEWQRAIAGDDPDSARAAIDAMRSSHGWSVLREMDRDGDYPKVLWEYADAMAGDGVVTGGKPSTIEESYKSALGCRE